MSAGISLMYKESGGCKIGKTCGTCRYLIKAESVSGFGKAAGKSEEYFCKKHPDTSKDCSSGHYWKASYMACRYFKNPIKPRAKASKRDAMPHLATAVTETTAMTAKAKIASKRPDTHSKDYFVMDEKSGQYTFA